MRVSTRQHDPVASSRWRVEPLPTTSPDGTDSPDRAGGSGDAAAGARSVDAFEVPRGAAVPDGQLTPRVVVAPPLRHAPMTWVGAHGGAGETSIATGSATGLALTQRWPDPELGWPSPVVLVARSNAAGLAAAARMVQEVLSGTVPDLSLHALVVVADAPGRLPKSLRTRVHELSGAVARVKTLEWIPAWRETPHSEHPSVTKLAAWAIEQITLDTARSANPHNHDPTSPTA